MVHHIHLCFDGSDIAAEIERYLHRLGGQSASYLLDQAQARKPQLAARKRDFQVRFLGRAVEAIWFRIEE